MVTRPSEMLIWLMFGAVNSNGGTGGFLGSFDGKISTALGSVFVRDLLPAASRLYARNTFVPEINSTGADHWVVPSATVQGPSLSWYNTEATWPLSDAAPSTLAIR